MSDGSYGSAINFAQNQTRSTTNFALSNRMRWLSEFDKSYQSQVINVAEAPKQFQSLSHEQRTPQDLSSNEYLNISGCSSTTFYNLTSATSTFLFERIAQQFPNTLSALRMTDVQGGGSFVRPTKVTSFYQQANRLNMLESCKLGRTPLSATANESVILTEDKDGAHIWLRGINVDTGSEQEMLSRLKSMANSLGLRLARVSLNGDILWESNLTCVDTEVKPDDESGRQIDRVY